MITNRELGIDDYLAIVRRRLKWIIIPALIAPLLGFLISFLETPKYTSRAELLVEGQVVPAGYVKPIVTERVSDRMTTLQQNILSRSRLQPLVERLGLVRKGRSEEDVIDQIRGNVSVGELDLGKARRSPFESRGPGGTADVSGFAVNYTTDNPRDAQQVCAEITSLLLAENVELREQVARSTTDFLTRQLEQSKHNLDDMDAKLSQFKIKHLGGLPGDMETNLRVLASMNSQLDASTQTIGRLEQDKSHIETLLEQELAAWKSSQAAPTFSTLRQQLLSLQNHLVILQTRYTDDYPDVVKTKHEIEQLQVDLREINSAAEKSDANRESTVPRGGAKMEPPHILGLREQIYHLDQAIDRATTAQNQLQERIDSFQKRFAISPEIEEEYKQLTRDNATAHSMYDQLLSNKSSAEIQTEMEHNQEGEQLKLLNPANLPSSPSSPVRSTFALYGLAAGFGLGLGIAVWLEFKDKEIRDEADVVAALELPMLGSLPWIGSEENGVSWKDRLRHPFTPRFQGQRTGS
jgi:polysaccharide chain length determinant protein (PEP-CTERM system associated)